MQYENVHDAEMRLRESIVRYAGQPVLVQRVSINNEGHIYALAINCLTNEELAPRLDSPLWDFSSPPLGYMSIPFPFGYQAYYAVRMPARKQVQGVIPSRLSVIENGTQKPRRNLLSLQSVGACIANIYHGHEYYTHVCSGKWSSNCVIAFSRDLAASLTHLYYRAYTIGRITHVDGRHLVNIIRPSFTSFNFREVFNEDWTFTW